MILEKVETSNVLSEENFRYVRAMDGVSIHIDPAALQSLELMVRESVKAIRGHGVEMGGLILGRPMDSNSRKLVITGFAPVEIEHRFGPSFRTSDTDLETFQKAASSVQGVPIGCFRSQVRTGMLIRDDDMRLLDSLFENRDCCFAPIEATVTTPSLLSFHHVAAKGHPRLIARFPVKQSNDGLVEPEVKTAATERVKVPAEQIQTKLPKQNQVGTNVSPLPVELLAKTPTAKTRSGYLWAALLTAAGLALAGTAFFFGTKYTLQPKAAVLQTASTFSPAPDMPIDLGITAVQSTVEIRWNRKNRGVLNATRGLLVLFDGPQPKRVELDQKQVLSGSYSFAARNPKISAWLTLYQVDGSFTGDSKEVLLNPSSSMDLPPNQERSLAAPQASSKSPSTTQKPRTGSPEVLPTLQSEAQPWLSRQPTPAPEPVRIPDLPDSPPPVRVTPVQSFQPPSVPMPDPPNPGLRYKGSVVRAVPARLLHQVTPAVPTDIGAKLRTEVQLEVAVSIDASGRVTGAHVASSQGAFASLLTLEVLKAAHLCVFAPAQEDGHATAGNAVLTFRFAPKPH